MGKNKPETKKRLEKNLATCSPREFLVQTNKIRKAVEGWLKATDIIAIRKNVPKAPVIPDDASADEIEEIMSDHRKNVREQAIKNMNDILDSILDEHPEETLDLIALLNFIEPSELDNYTVSEILRSVTQIMNNEDVLGFFISLTRLEQLNIFDA